MQRTYSIRPASQGDTGQILELVSKSLGTGTIPRDIAFWSWKHRSNPFGPSQALVAVASDDKIVGLRAFMNWHWDLGTETVLAVRAVDTATDPDWQGRGIFSRLTVELAERVRREGVSFIFNTPNSLSRPGYLKLGWSNVGRIVPFVRLLSWKTIFGGGHSRNKTFQTADFETSQLVRASFNTIDRLLQDAELHDFIESCRPRESRLSTRLSPGFLRWRYSEVPGFEYSANWRLNAKDRAIVVFRVGRRGQLRELRLCEILVEPNRFSTRTAVDLIREVVATVPADFVIAFAAKDTLERVALHRAGFLPVPKVGPILTVKPLIPSTAANPTLKSSWRLSIGDVELF